MSSVENQGLKNLSDYIKELTDQEIKVLLLKLKNEMKKEDITWEQIRDILAVVNSKDETILPEIIPFLVA